MNESYSNFINKELIKQAKIELARRDLFSYCKYLDSEDFYNEETAPYLKEICDAIQEFRYDDNEALIMNMPPRFGKTRTVNNSVSWLLGDDPSVKIMLGSYNTILSIRSAKIIRNKILATAEDDKIVFSDVFPSVSIKEGFGAANHWGLNNNEEENFLATSPGSTSTGIGCDYLILDDTVKNKYEAYNKEILRQIYEDWFRDTLYQRLEGKRKIIILMTRWSTFDLAGKVIDLFESQGRKYRLITKKAYYPETDTYLNPTILDQEKYSNLIQTIGEDIVKANYDQEPIDIKGKLYQYFMTYSMSDINSKNNPDGSIKFKMVKAICDTADKGSDYLCMIIYGVTNEKKAYILDVYYTQEPMEVTEQKAAELLLKYEPYVFEPESNNGGRGWSRAVERIYKEMGGYITKFKPYTQGMNKEARILSMSATVQNMIYFPDDWRIKYREFYDSMNEYQREGKNIHDDAEDTVTAIAERLDVDKRPQFA